MELWNIYFSRYRQCQVKVVNGIIVEATPAMHWAIGSEFWKLQRESHKGTFDLFSASIQAKSLSPIEASEKAKLPTDSEVFRRASPESNCEIPE